MDSQKKQNTKRLVVFILVALVGLLFSGYNLEESIGYYKQCQPRFELITQADYDAGLFMTHRESNIDPNSYAAKEAIKSAKEDFKYTEWYKTQVRESIFYVALACVFVIVTIAAIVSGITVICKTKLQTSYSQQKFMLIIIALIVVTLVNAIWPNKPYRYVSRFMGPVLPAIVTYD